MDRHYKAKNTGGSRVLSGIVREGLMPNTLRIDGPQGFTMTFPASMYPFLHPGNNPSIILAFVLTELEEINAPSFARQ